MLSGIQSVHFVGICGSAMAGTAAAMRQKGFEVTGSDQSVYPTMSTFLAEQGIPVITVDTFIDDGMYQDGAGDGDFPMAYVASDNVGGGRMAARFMAEALGGEGKVYVSNVRPGISTTDQREEGFKAEMAENYPNIEVLDTQYNENDASLAASQFNAVLADL